MLPALFSFALVMQEFPVIRLQPRSAPQNWVQPSDYPDSAVRRDAFGMVRFRLDVDATGSVTGCHILNTSGFWVLDERTCLLLSRRAKFYPARDASGEAIPAVFVSNFFWAHGDANLRDWKALVRDVTDPFRMDVTVKKLPASYKEPALARVRFLESDGKPELCTIELSSGSAATDRVACDQLMRSATLPESTRTGMRRPDSRMYLVAFDVEQAP